ncbi:hypothetical protein ACIRQF_22390 [Streptomyces sp. NPDC101191]|uniref:hypothetical protein n=1 Tax=Streptomyces sp. NPDC101191 TaxID=3366126 RepID=UPI0037F792FC
MRFRPETGILLATLGMAAGALTLTGAAAAAAVPGGAVPGGAAWAPRAAHETTHAGDALAGNPAAVGSATPGRPGPAPDPKPSPSAPSVPPSSQRAPAAPNSGPHAGPHAGPNAGPNGDGQGGVTAHTGERVWLLGGLGLALAATGVVARAAIRSRTESSRTEP